ncbi:sensor histidine kinase [Rhizobium sp. C4]|uniref:sensor histidine kinase n=1 Tax=Rhizobium sp. C4 TaxID=1349800 RepID=UPI001E374EEB|nr:ATP-binding protein [Rhizobium sp. C4]MCD2172503.1 ATP-binding protein [Rhizobium sp. C4]
MIKTATTEENGAVSPHVAGLKRRVRRAWLIFAAVFVVGAVLVALAANRYGRDAAVADLLAQGRTEINLKSALLRSVLERPRALPLVLSQDRDVSDALLTRSASDVDRLNRKLEALVTGTKAAVIYVTNDRGVAIASSNWQEKTSFVGSDYSFRAYFRDAMANGAGEQFALGSVSNRPGLYISNRVLSDGRMLGVVVVKMEFEQLENDWRDSGRPAFITGSEKVVLVTNLPSWRFMTVGQLDPGAASAIRESLQFGGAPLQPLPLRQAAPLPDGITTVRAVLPGGGEASFIELQTEVATTSWVLHYLVPLQPALGDAVWQTMFLAFAVFLGLSVLTAIVMWRRQANLFGQARAALARAELERRVRERTRDLSRARDLLQAEVSEHRNTEQRLKGVQQELVAANRLAILGQVAAGVAHEINQPLATIRAYAENAQTFLERQKIDTARENVGLIVDLTQRIATITDELRAFARKGRGAPEPVPLRNVLEGAVVLLKTRFAGRIEAIVIDLPAEDFNVLGNRIRLEQVFINLFQNALEALQDRADARVEVTVEKTMTGVTVHVADNGPGIPPEIRDVLFTPFNTSKEQGLGLGLVISKEILADYGGAISVESDETGTRFAVGLKGA